MATLDERVTQDLETLKRLWPALQERLAWRAPSGQPDTTGLDADAAEMEMAETQLPEDFDWPPSLEALLDQCSPLPSHSVIMGVCEDGLPFVLDLTNPAPGSLVALGDTGSGKTRLLKAVLASAIYLNSEETVNFSLVAPDLDEYPSLSQVGMCWQVVPAEESTSEELAELIGELAAIVEARRRSTPGDPAIILAIDDLARCLQFLDDQAFVQLYGLIKHGPRSRVWIIATLSPERSTDVDPRLLAAFRTRLIGTIADPELAFYLSGDENLETGAPEEGSRFWVPYGDGWVRFWICEPDSLA